MFLIGGIPEKINSPAANPAGGKMSRILISCACALLLAGAPLLAPGTASDAWAAKQTSSEKSAVKKTSSKTAKKQGSSSSHSVRAGKRSAEQYPAAGIGSAAKAERSGAAPAGAKGSWTKETGPCIPDGKYLNLSGSWKSAGGQAISGALQGREGRSMRLVLTNAHSSVIGYALLRTENGGTVQILQSRDAAAQKLLVTAGYACMDALRLKAGTPASVLQTGSRLHAEGKGYVFEDPGLTLHIGGRNVIDRTAPEAKPVPEPKKATAKKNAAKSQSSSKSSKTSKNAQSGKSAKKK